MAGMSALKFISSHQRLALPLSLPFGDAFPAGIKAECQTFFVR